MGIFTKADLNAIIAERQEINEMTEIGYVVIESAEHLQEVFDEFDRLQAEKANVDRWKRIAAQTAAH